MCGGSSSDGHQRRETMTNTIKVPDIGDFKDVPVIEVYVKPGQAIAAEERLITLESDKSAMYVPAPSAGCNVEVGSTVGGLAGVDSVIGSLLLARSGQRSV